ncbi:hypothetical protein P280DRAFT_15898 [Massarina eburnea CBS 473.64]|uniref:DUF4048 domain-containing protein n=1 Tax=Massarina eburnea CBS 473.64 TaxID=1395130 RepID=A0A6A6SFQ7_9PLEO|nr:hypothetical protein P280DRAFT_15898 [Massarina eburnea CBS 473.64]
MGRSNTKVRSSRAIATLMSFSLQKLSKNAEAAANVRGMGSPASSPAVLKAYVSWLKSGFLWRLLGVPAALLACYLEVYGSSPRTTSLILYRLSRRLRLSAISCMFRADVMSAAESRRTSNLTTLDQGRIPPGGSVSGLTPHKESHLTSQPSPTADTMHARSLSNIDSVRQSKRLSLQFPIQRNNGSSSPAFSPRSRPQSWVAAPSPVPSPDAVSTPETNLLAIVAAQERYVLELKEELTKAEQDLKMLKKHYATQEAMKQRNDLRKVTQLQPLNTNLANGDADQDDEDGSALWMQKEMERRKVLLSTARSSQRKVFSGSRHLRTLSLLSPDTSYTPSFPQPLDIRTEPSSATSLTTTTTTKFNSHMRPPPVTRDSATPIIADQIADTVNGERYDVGGLSNVQRDVFLRTGKQMATDFKDGLWTFIEDIRQATVGEEPVTGPEHAGSSAKPSRKCSDARPTLQRAKSSKNSASKIGGIGDEFWKEHGLSEPKASPAHKKTHALKHPDRTPQKHSTQKTGEEFEDWDSWDTPHEQHSRAAKEEDANSSDESAPPSPVSRQASSRTSTSSMGLPDDALPRDPKRNSIPWPDLVKYSPTNLKRTASHLMKEWEKNLTPPPESRETTHASGDYIGRAVSPAPPS